MKLDTIIANVFTERGAYRWKIKWDLELYLGTHNRKRNETVRNETEPAFNTEKHLLDRM